VTCDAALAVLSDFVDDELPPHQRAELEAHLRGCAGCGRRFARLHLTQQLVRSAAPDWSAVPRTRPRSPTSALSPAVLAVSAALLMIVAVGRHPLVAPAGGTAPPARPSTAASRSAASPAVAEEPGVDCRIPDSEHGCVVVLESRACESPEECGPPSLDADLP
jgi:anti-sigma factor RsiW